MTRGRGVLAPRRAWSEFEDEVLRAHYAATLTADLAELLGRPLSSTHQRARALGLKKSLDWIAQAARERSARPGHGGAAHRFAKGLVPANKGLRRPGWAPGDMARTQFKKGRPASEARNYLPIGSHRLSKDGYLERKVTDDPSIVPARRWVGVHRLVWIAARGEIPDGHVVVFRPGRRTTTEGEITVDGLECITRAELADRNRAPAALRPIVQLRGAITRQINKRLKEQSE